MIKVDEVFKLNEKYEENGFNGIYQGISNFKIMTGQLPILLSAPHAVKQVRNGLFKDSDGLTGGIVEYLAAKHNVYGITRVHNLLDDPNFYNYGVSLLYKKAIIKLIKENNIQYLFDIHGCSDDYGYKAIIGTNNGLNIRDDGVLEMLKDYLSWLGNVSVDYKFKASLSGNISRYVHEETGISTYQMELSKNVRIDNIDKLVDTFGEIIGELKKRR